MKDWIQELDGFAIRYGKGVLPDAGKISQKDALAKAEAEYKKYRQSLTAEITQVERKYLTSIKETQKKLMNKND